MFSSLTKNSFSLSSFKILFLASNLSSPIYSLVVQGGTNSDIRAKGTSIGRLRLQNYKDGTWQVAKYDETGENIIIESLPEVGQFEDERMFGFDMTLDPYFSKSGDLVLPGEGVFGMRNGELRQVASSMSRPLDEMLMYGIPGGEYMAKNVTDKIAFQGPEM